MKNYKVIYGCETKDGGTGFGQGTIICENDTDAKAVWRAIQKSPESFDFAPHADGRRLVRIEGDCSSTRIIPDQPTAEPLNGLGGQAVC